MVFRSVRPDPDAERFADQMVSDEETMREILQETVTPHGGEILESGRTACGSMADIAGPLSRFPRSVNLQTCPMGMAGTWHSHVSTRQLLNPEHSLPDMANVIFEGIDASVVVGAETSDVLVGASNREAAADTFRNTLGVEATSTEEVVHAIDGGEIPRPSKARERVRSKLSPLFRREQTPFPEIAQKAQTISAGPAANMASPDGVTAVEPMYADFYGLLSDHVPAFDHNKREEEAEWYTHTPSHAEEMRQQADRVNSGIARNVNAVKGTVVKEAGRVAIAEVTRQAIRGML